MHFIPFQEMLSFILVCTHLGTEEIWHMIDHTRKVK